MPEINFPEILPLCPPGLILEFGVWKGHSLNFIAQCAAPLKVYGFDWFHGLPGAWPPDSTAPGLFSTDGVLPDVEPNAELVVGKVEETLKPFLREQQNKIALVHFDMDLYEPTKFALDAITPWLQSGSVFAFDEIDGQPRCSDHEQRAFWEWHNENRWRILFLGRRHYTSWVVKVIA